MKMKVYLVYRRDYGDTLIDEVVKAFDSKEKAENYIKNVDSGSMTDEDFYWEEMEVD